jgi:hypothetical protein
MNEKDVPAEVTPSLDEVLKRLDKLKPSGAAIPTGPLEDRAQEAIGQLSEREQEVVRRALALPDKTIQKD